MMNALKIREETLISKLRIRILIVPLLIAVTCLLQLDHEASASTQVVTSKPVDAMPIHAAPMESTPEAVTFQTLDTALTAQLPDSYGGMNLDSSGNQVIHIVKGAESVASTVINSSLAQIPSGEAMPTSKITIVPANVSLNYLQQQQAIVTANIPVLSSEGVDVNAWGPDITNNTLRVTVYNLNNSATNAILGLVNSSTTQLISESSPVLESASSTTDSLPWYGGDFLKTFDYGSELDCSSGIPVLASSGGTFNITAGHCSTGSGSSHTVSQNGQGYGFVYQRYYCNNCNGDFESVTTYPNSADGFVYTGGPHSSSATPVTGNATNYEVNSSVCFDGYAMQLAENQAGYNGGSGIPCSIITEANFCLHGALPNVVCDQWESDSGGSVWESARGDSGGPVFRFNSTGVTAMGSITGVGACWTDLLGFTVCHQTYFNTQAAIDFAFGVAPASP